MSEETDVDIDVDNQEVDSSPAELEARQFGWVPKEEFRGDDTEWKDAETFLKRGKEINGFLRKDLEKIQTELRKRDEKIAEMQDTMQQFAKFHEETEARAYKRALTELQKEKADAIASGDGERVVEIDEQIDLVKTAQKKPPEKEEKAAAPKENDREYYLWLDQNEWYVANPELAQIAEKFGETISVTNPSLKGRDFLEEVTRRVKKARPDLFENPARSDSRVGSSSDSRVPSGNKRKKSFSDLPSEAQEACRKYVKQGLLTEEQYLKDYDWSE